MSNSLEELKKHTVVVADTGDFKSIAEFKPQDSTTNPSLILAAANDKKYSSLIDDCVKQAKKIGGDINTQINNALSLSIVTFGTEILKIVPGRVSTEIDARFSFDTEATIQKAKELVKLYEKYGIGKDRVLYKIASTWEGIQAAKELEKEGIHCNLTLLFSVAQAAAADAVGVTLISPFVGRITDFYKNKLGVKEFIPNEDPGVKSVHEIFKYLKSVGSNTIVMGASFRNVNQIIELAGCDYLTIAPSLLKELSSLPSSSITKKLNKDIISIDAQKMNLDEKKFRFLMCQDEMASYKTDEGVRRFSEDIVTFEKKLKELLEKS